MSNRFDDLAKSVDHFREALAFDPRYAAAWAGMAHTYFILAWFYLAPPDIVMPLSKAAALKAQELDPDSSHGLVPWGVSEGGIGLAVALGGITLSVALSIFSQPMRRVMSGSPSSACCPSAGLRRRSP